jgi:RecA-family ATPase
MTASSYLVDTILPAGEIHLLGGPTGAGKTRWLFDTLLDWHAGKSVLGYSSHPCPWLYVSSDRSEASVYRTLETMNLDRERIPLLSAMDKRLTLNQILDAAQERHAQLVVIESFGGFVDSTVAPNTRQIKNFFYSLRPFLNATNATIIGVVESPKMKPKERYENPRQRISGAAAWGHYGETIILIEPVAPDTPNSNRNIIVCPRNAAEKVIEAEFLDGHLVPTIFN